MMRDYAYRDADLAVFRDELDGFLPHKIIDAHVHIWRRESIGITPDEYDAYRRYKPWTDFWYNEQFTAEDFSQCSARIYPGREISGMFFGLPFERADIGAMNAYVMENAARHGAPFYYIPTQHENIFETQGRLDLLGRKGFVGFKPYPDLVQGTGGECGIFEMLNRSVLEFSDKHGLTVMLHIPGKAKLRSEENRRDLLEIVRCYPNTRIIMAHVGRAFTYRDVEGLIDFLLVYDNIWFDTACVNDPMVLEYLFRRAHPGKLLYGTDAPIAYYRGKDVTLNNKHYFVTDKLVPWGFGPTNDSLAQLTLIVYEELRAILFAMKAVHGKALAIPVEKFFYQNAQQILARP